MGQYFCAVCYLGSRPQGGQCYSSPNALRIRQSEIVEGDQRVLAEFEYVQELLEIVGQGPCWQSTMQVK